ncbi:flavin reductase family protein [Saccharibacillus alkalitolerans]|uniref:Flavin reductase family protein n=1 Tax=Saccharibacillus alkalitolerans TaxID=2705290 RepID=A0ABX0F013_9BACL|nr:flavin reductase family protein [Saccharibacillus alkalitolerans]NGZ74346.1 flavin reductase family protein [Saccharibacillus alkalitolerans]
MRKAIEGEKMHAYPGMVAMVTSRAGEKRNVMAAGWHAYIGSGPGMYGIALREETFSYGLIKKAGVFGVNFLPAERTQAIQGAGTLTGSDADKLEALGIGFEDGLKTGVPILNDAYMAYECRVADMNLYGDHYWIVGEIVQVYQDEALFGEDGLPDLSKLSIPLYMGRASYRVLDERAEKKVHRP